MTEPLHPPPQVPDAVRRQVQSDYERFANFGLPHNLEDYLLERYGIDVASEYAGRPIRNPWGKASGQLSMTSHQVAEDVEAGLGFVVLKTVIAQDAQGERTMDAWATREARMVVEPIMGHSGDKGWTVSWKGRGWWQSFEDYLDLVRSAQGIAHDRGTLIVPSCKYHLPGLGEAWKRSEYEFTTTRLLEAWSQGDGIEQQPMPIEKDFSPTLAGSDLATARPQILEWLQRAPALIREGAGSAGRVTVGLKLFNALFDDEFQLEMLRAVHAPDNRPDFFVYGNRLFDPDRDFEGHRGIAYGGPDLSDRNLRVLSAFQKWSREAGIAPLPFSATGNITSGRMALEYTLRGASSFQLHTFFQLPNSEYTARVGTKAQRALHELYFHPREGFVVWMRHIAERLGRQSIGLRDVVGASGERGM